MNMNTELFYFINHGFQNSFFDAVMPGLSNTGGFVSLLCICILAIILTRYFKKDRYYNIAKMCLYALILSAAIAGLLKLTFHSPRPYTVLSDVHQLTVPSEPNSFPSGHTSSSLSIITVLLWKFRQHKILAVLLVVYAFLIGFSRVYVGVHYPFDVFAGTVIGILSGVVVLKLKN